MKVSNAIKKMVVISVFCSQVITLYPMQEVQTRPSRLSELSVKSHSTLLDEDTEFNADTIKMANQDLFTYDLEATGTMPQDIGDDKDKELKDAQHQRKKTLDAALAEKEAAEATAAIPGMIEAEQDRKPSLAARRLSSITTEIPEVEPTLKIVVESDLKMLAGRLSGLSAVEVEAKIEADQTTHTKAELDAKIEQAREKTSKINQLIEDIKQSMTKAKGYLATGLERGAYLIAAANVVMIIWSTIDAARNVETLPYAVYITDAALIVLTATAQILHSLHNKLKQEEETEFIPEDHPGNIPQSAITFKQQLRNKLSHCWSTVTNCLSKIAGTHLITGAALVSAGVTFTAARWPQVISPLAAEWIDNGENILDGLIIAWVIFSKKAINKLYAIRAKKEAQRRASDDGIVHKKTELQTLPDRRDSLKPEVQVEVKKKHGTKGSIEMVSSLPEESPITMVANPLASVALETDRDGHESDESPTDTDKNSTPEKRDSSEKTSQASSVQVSPAMPPKQLDFTAEAETEPIPTV